MNRHVVTCQARTGSTMLRHLINDHAQCINHGEIFKLWRTLHFFKNVRVVKDFGFPLNSVKKAFKNDKKDFFENFVFNSRGAADSIGFKFKTDELYNPHFKPLADYILNDTDIKIIHLKRKDLFRQYISKLTVLNNAMPKFYMKEDKNLALKDIMVDLKHFDAFVSNCLEEDKLTTSNFEGHDVLPLWYEDVLRDPSLRSNQLYDFLEVDNQKVDFKTKKIIEDHCLLVKNIDELYDYARKSNYQERLQCLLN